MKFIASLIGLSLLTVGAYAADLFVPSQYPTIQGAINAAANSGDTIHVAAGTYIERQIAWSGKSLILQGAGQGQSIVEWGNFSFGLLGVIQLYNVPSTARVDGFTIRNGFSDRGFGGGMSLESSSPTVSNCTFTNCNSNYGGGGVSNLGGSPTFINCSFVNNLATGTNGGGFYNHSGSPILTNCTFVGNSADEQGGGMPCHGGGMFCESGNPTLTNCLFNGNGATAQGGGLWGAL